MKNKKVLLFSLAALLSGSALTAQTGQWKLAGNALNGTQKLGSTNNFSLDFITNNVKRMSLTNKGNLQINSDQTSIQFSNPGATPKPMMFIYESGSVNTSRMLFAYSPSFANFGLQYTLGDRMDFLGSGISVLDVDLANKRVGVGTTAPKSKLHVFNGASGATPFSLSSLTVENSTSNYVNILAPTSSETGILFGHNANNISGGIIYNNPATLNGLQFRTNGNTTRMVLNKDGFLNVGAGVNEDYRVRIDHRDALGLDIANSLAGTDWEIFADDDGLFLFADGGVGGPKGVFNRSTGVYTASPFGFAQTNIKPMNNVLEKISQLKPSSYKFKNAKNQQEYNGFVAREVMKVFPDLVTHYVSGKRNLDTYTLDYNGFGTIAIKGIQELVKINESKDARIDSLQQQIDELRKLITGSSQHPISSDAVSNATISISSASLEQNTPNPFKNSTSIHYTLPQKFSTAQIIITDNSGKIIKQLNVSGTGKGAINIDAATLSAGVYNYSLVIDGKMISTKQMMK